MARSAFVEVNITNPTKLAQDSQDTADNAVKGVTDLNDPNLMSVIEKQNNVVQFAGLTSQYNVLVQNAKDEGIDTTAVTTAYNNLNKFMADVLADPDHASDVDRVTYKKYQDAYNEESAKLQNALQNNANNKFTSAASATSQAASTANVAKSAADNAYAYASSEIAIQSNATAKAQSTADSAFSKAQEVGNQADSQIASQASAVSEVSKTASEASSQANSALDKADSANAEIIRLKGGSTATIAKLEDGLGTKVSNDTFTSYQTQTASQFAQTVKEADFKTYQTQTSNLIESKVDNGTYQSDKTETAEAIASKVESSEFKTYQTQTDKAIASKVSGSDYESDREQTASQIADKVSSGEFSTYKTQTDKLIGSKVDNGDFSTYKTQTADLISSKVANSDFSAYQATTAKEISSKVESSDFQTYKTQTDGMIASKVSKKDANNVNLIPYSSNFSDSLEGWQLMAWGATDRKLLVTTHSFYKNGTGKLLYLNTAQNATSAAGSLRFSVLPNTKYTFQFKAFASPNVVGANVYFLSRAYGSTNDYDTAHGLFNNLVTSPSHIDQYTVTFTTGANDNEGYIRVDNIGSNNGASSGLFFTELKMEPGDTATNYIYGGQDSMISQMSNDILFRVTKDDLIDQINIQAGNTLISSSGQLTLSGKSVFLDSVDPVIMKSANIDTLLVGKKLTAADIAANTFTTNNGTFTVDSNGLVTATSLIIRGSTNLIYNASLSGGNGSYIPGWNLFTKGYYSNVTLHDGVPSIGFNSSTGSGTWVTFAQSKLIPLNGLTGQPYSLSVWFIDAGSDATMTYQVTLAFFDSSGNRLPSGNYTSANLHGTGSAQPWTYLTIDGFNAPSTAVSVGIQYWAYNGTGHALFSSPMLTQTAHSTGYQPDAGNVVSAGTVLGSIISGSTINATTFHGGDLINNANNTSNFYPFTIEASGKASTTLFNSMDAIRTEMSGGGLRTMYRAINASGSQYEAYDGDFTGNMISLNSGFTNGKDMSFSQSVSGNQLTGQVTLSPLNGIHLWGSTQSIHFSGLQMNGTGITFNSYGNIIADQASTWWRVTNFSGSDIANFGTDTSGSNPIQFNRELDIGNIQINTGHTVTSADKGAIHFAKGGGGTVDIYAGAVHYTSLVNSSLLSVKRDVKKADTAYWAQLVNAIDLATYQYKTDDNTSHIRLSGIVDDINETKQWQLPDIFINRDENGKLSGVDNSVLLNAALATIQEQQKQISALNGHNMELESRLNKLEDKLNE
ncbi:hypothetical protein [Lactobacillus phage Maenad]|uniref:Peptidase S74 domain-containing protein n=1 Tax=Lactobacillus phage Maenad TaxID=2079431 RepID=A0A2P0ZL34_9CAUD|nr:tail fiber protein [Lactobacillus phage Maenad]AVH85657.1 hypothetical protein [Lactobacillus phage Maenad]